MATSHQLTEHQSTPNRQLSDQQKAELGNCEDTVCIPINWSDILACSHSKWTPRSVRAYLNTLCVRMNRHFALIMSGQKIGSIEVDTYMGFPKNWSDWSTPLDSMEHSFAEDGSVPRLIVSNIPNSWRLRLLGNACCPQQSIFAMENLWSRSNVLDVPSFLQEMRPVSPSAFELSRKRRRVVDTSIVMTRK